LPKQILDTISKFTCTICSRLGAFSFGNSMNPHFSPLAQETSAGFFLPKFAKKQPSASTLLPV
jgi:hypothetical protein